jgi:choline dehydrogenase-like flavoprotein
MLAFSAWRKTDRLRKTMLLTHPKFPHSSVQPLGGTHASVIVQTQLPRFAPRLAVDLFGQRAEGFFLTTEDGSHPDNRVRARADGAAYPVLDYDPGRRPSLLAEHRGFVRYFRAQLMRQGFVCFSRAIGLAGTAHACGTLSTGNDPARSVVDAEGRVHGMENLYVVDGSVLPSSSRANPSLTIYAWALRVASRL